MRVGGRTDIGKVRKTNEDAMGYDLERGIFVVADGMGGHAAGEVASRMAVDTILADIEDRPAGLEPADAMFQAIVEANRRISTSAGLDPALKGMGTTVVAALIVDGRCAIGHVGDSRVYLVRQERIIQLTEDHSMVQELVKRGAIPAEAAETHPLRNTILRSLGQNPSVEVDILTLDWEEQDCLILCTDGLTRFARPEEILEATRSETEPDKICSQLVDLALDRGGRDNITLVVVRGT
ncbi:MAG: Stp1/IreP family PP2C-type Ser/Thr phosphatase [Candidatus Sericytochromatia bacterium]|nr:Stp1/IreP family PP2C-type Ser/Thr phosphatase [Candidatus Sericytochromatia bacterium]